MSDLETRVREALADHAARGGDWRGTGRSLRTAADGRRAARRRTVAVTGAAAMVAVTVAGAALLGGRTASETPPAGGTATPTPTASRADGSPLRVAVPDDVVSSVRDDLALGGYRLTASAELPGTHRTALLFTRKEPPPSGYRVRAATVTLDGTTPVAGTTAGIGDGEGAIALPVRDGDATVLMVLTMPYWVDATVEVTVGRPGSPSVVVTRPVIGRVALVPVPAPDVVTGISVLNLQDGSTGWEGIPGGPLPVGVPDRLDRIAVSTGTTPQSVQVRTDGRTACRVTVDGFSAPRAFAMDWNPFDVACAQIDGRLHLLLAADRRYSSVAGVAPQGTTTVRLHWRDGTTKDVEVSDDPSLAFVDRSHGRPDLLVRAQALDVDGTVLGTAEPGPTFP